jgi:cell division protein FtsQ
VTAVAAPADRRFRRAHTRPARKRRGWRALVNPAIRYGLGLVVLVVAVYRGATIIAHARVLQVSRVVVTGNDRLAAGDVLAMLDGLKGESLVWTDLAVWRRHLLASPWIRDASLRRSLPSTVQVAIAERRPVAIGRLKGDMYLVDERGVVIDQYGPKYADLDLPIVDGLAPAGGDRTTMTDVDRADLAARLIAAIRAKPDMARRLSQIDVSDAHNAAVLLSGDPAVIYLGDDQFLPRLQSYVELTSALRDRVPDIDYVDLRFDNRIYVRPAGGVRSSARPAVQTTAAKAAKPTAKPAARRRRR